jgi:membrane-associated phospholipid phosphatase
MPRRARMALTAACFGALLLVAIWYAAHYIPFVRHADASVLGGFVGLDRPRLDRWTNAIAGLCDPGPFVFLAAMPVAVAFLRGRVRVAVMLAVILLCANETTELLKPLLAGPRDPVPGNWLSDASWPSGHATAAMTLCMCWVIAVPSRWRPAVAGLMAMFAIAVSYSFLELGWHYPSDVLGGFLVATVWALLGIAGLSIYEQRYGGRVTERPVRFTLAQALGPPAAVAAGALLLALVLVLSHPHGFVSYVHGHKWFVVGAGTIAVLGFGLAAGVMLMLRASARPGRPDRTRPLAASPPRSASQR